MTTLNNTYGQSDGTGSWYRHPPSSKNWNYLSHCVSIFLVSISR